MKRNPNQDQPYLEQGEQKLGVIPALLDCGPDTNIINSASATALGLQVEQNNETPVKEILTVIGGNITIIGEAKTTIKDTNNTELQVTIYISPDIVLNTLFLSCDTMRILNLPGNKEERLLEDALPLEDNWWEIIGKICGWDSKNDRITEHNTKPQKGREINTEIKDTETNETTNINGS